MIQRASHSMVQKRIRCACPQCTRQRFLVGHCVRQPDALDDPERPGAPSVSSQDKGLKANADGSADVYFGPKAPPAAENNWVQTLSGKILRLYGPLEPWFDKSWRPGEIEPVPS
jgi:hypothetical protein